MSTSDDPVNFEALLRAQLILLKIEQRAPDTLQGLSNFSLILSKASSSENFSRPLEEVLKQVALKSPILAEEIRVATDATIDQLLK